MGWKKSLNSLVYESMVEPQKLHLEEIRPLLHDALRQCEGPIYERMRVRIDEARTAQHLWLLREEIFQLVALQFCQEEASQRINALLPAFSGWLPERTLTRV